jgi:hypothetical protein
MFFKKILSAIIILISLTAWVYSCFSIKSEYAKLSLSKHLYADIKNLTILNSKMQPSDLLYISSDLGENQFMVSRWIGYILASVNLIYAPECHAGGYLVGLEEGYEKNIAHITHVLEKYSEDSGFNGKSIFKNKTFHVRPLSPPELIVNNGFYSPEHWGRWMGEKGELTILGKNASELEMQITTIYPLVQPESQNLLIQTQIGDSIFSIIDNNKTIRVPLDPELSLQKVTITPQFQAKSPFESGNSADSRRLSVGFSKVKINKK